MIANFLEYFYTDKFDEKIILKKNSKNYSVKMVKDLVFERIQNNLTLNSTSKDFDNFSFVINFFAEIFTNKNIFIDEINSKKMIDNGKFNGFTELNPKDIIINFQTSGTTGEKKIAQKSLENLFSESEALKNQFPTLLKDKEFISTTTMNHLFGFTFHLILPLNSENVINTDIVAVPENINVENSCLISTPSFIAKMAKYQNYPVKNPQVLITAGAELKENIFKFAKEISSDVIEIYGSTETGVIAYRNSFDERFHIFKEVELDCSENFVMVKTNFSLISPVKIMDKIEKFYNDDILVKGRTDRVYKIQEKRISALEIEKVLNSCEFLKDSYIVKTDEKLACLAVLTQAGLDYLAENNIVELIKKLKSIVKTKYEIVPQKWKFIDEIPHTVNGKIDKKEINYLFDLNLSFPVVVDKNFEDGKFTVSLYFYSNCNFFKGHFNGFHIVPGVVQLFYAQYFARRFFGVDCVSGQYRKIKFTNIIQPDKVLKLELEQIKNGISYKYIDENCGYSSGILPIKTLNEGIKA